MCAPVKAHACVASQMSMCASLSTFVFVHTLVYPPACVCWYAPLSVCRHLSACIFYFGWSWAALLTACQGHVTLPPAAKTAV